MTQFESSTVALTRDCAATICDGVTTGASNIECVVASTTCEALTSGTFHPDSVASFASLGGAVVTRPDGVVAARCGTARAIISPVLTRLPTA